MIVNRENAPMNHVTLAGCSNRHRHRVLCHHAEEFQASSSEQQDNNFSRSTSTSGVQVENVQPHDEETEEKIRKKLKWFFMNPYEKYKLKGRKPWKLVLQIFKIAFITAQATWFAVDLQSVVTFDTDNLAAFRHVFIKSYPGNLKYVPIFTKPDLYNRMCYVWAQYYNFSAITAGSYDLPKDPKDRRVQLCVYKLDFQSEGDYDDDNFVKTCSYLKPPNSSYNHNVTNFLLENKIPSKYEFITKMVMNFSMQTTNWKHDLDKNQADCYTYDISATFNNDDYDGLMQFRLYFESSSFKPCKKSPSPRIVSQVKLGVEVFVIIICIISFSLCMRSHFRHVRLCLATTKFFQEFRHEHLTFSDKMNFMNFWIILVILSDILVIAGTMIKIAIDFADFAKYDACGLLLGVAVLFSWIGILRYLGFSRGYNTLLVTLKVAFPQVIRFIICAGILYFGFAFCGWVVFGPYHSKFKDIVTTSQCLFSLVNGDDMFNTFKLMETSDYTLWIFSKVYLYVFISLFIFVILSLFIGIIGDTYERIKDYGHPPKTRIQLFMEGLEYNEDISDEGGNQSDETADNMII